MHLGDALGGYNKLQTLVGERIGVAGVTATSLTARPKFCIGPGYLRLAGICAGNLWAMFDFERYGLQCVFVDMFTGPIFFGGPKDLVLNRNDPDRAIEAINALRGQPVSYAGYMYYPYPAMSRPVLCSGNAMLMSCELIDSLIVANLDVNTEEPLRLVVVSVLPAGMPGPSLPAAEATDEGQLPVSADVVESSKPVSQMTLAEATETIVEQLQQYTGRRISFKGATAAGLITGTGTLVYWDYDRRDVLCIHVKMDGETKTTVVMPSHVELAPALTPNERSI